MEHHLLETNATSVTLHVWSPMGVVLRIKTLALVVIAISFLLAAFGSICRWSNRWIVQKGFLAAQALSLSLGIYTIGLMQSSSVKSEMYPIWAVSLLTLFGCIDPAVTSCNGLNYKGPLMKMIYQLCLYCGYVLLLISTISGVSGNIALSVLCGITFIKTLHRSMALVLPSRRRDQIEELHSLEPGALAREGQELKVHVPIPHSVRRGKTIQQWSQETSMADIYLTLKEMPRMLRSASSSWDQSSDDIPQKTSFFRRWQPEKLSFFIRCQLEKLSFSRRWQPQNASSDDVDSTHIIDNMEDVCLGYSLSHLLQRRFLGLDTASEMEAKREKFENLVRCGKEINYKRTLKAIEVELAFLYEVFFTSNEFLHYHEAKASSFWALASFIAICFVGVAVAIPGRTASHKAPNIFSGDDAGAVVVVHTTTADLITTIVILVCLAVLQLVQLIRCWTSNWARVLFACEYVSSQKDKQSHSLDRVHSSCFGVSVDSFRAGEECEVIMDPEKSRFWWLWMGLKGFVVTRMQWIDNKYLWQDKLGQYSLVDDAWSHSGGSRLGIPPLVLTCMGVPEMCACIGRMLGLQYIRQVLRELWPTNNTGPTVRLHEDVKTCIATFLRQIKSRTMRVEDWSSWFVHNRIEFQNLPFNQEGAYSFTQSVMMWHVATCYCEKNEEGNGGEQSSCQGGNGGAAAAEKIRYRPVAIALSKYFAYLVASAPELLPGPSAETKRGHKAAFDMSMAALYRDEGPCLLKADGQPAGQYKRKGSTVQKSMDCAGDAAPGIMMGKKLLKLARQMPLNAMMGKTLLNSTKGKMPLNATQPCGDHWEVLARLWVQTLVYAAPYGDVQSHMQHLSQGGELITHLWALLYHIGIDRWEREEPHRYAGAGPAPGSALNLLGEAEIEEMDTREQQATSRQAQTTST